jgi:glycosyltransferase involved in cell wall biosynthesis
VLPAAQHSKVGVLHNGVNITLFHPPACWSPDPAAPRFLSVMWLEDNKNPLLLINAFRRLLDHVPGARLDIVGTGPLHDAVVARIRLCNMAHAVTLHGFKGRDEVAALMRERCDALVLPSHSETFGVVLIEALASGKPLVVTDCGGPRDIVTDPSLGVLCRPGDEQSLYEGLRAVAANLPRYRSDLIRRHAIQHFDYSNLAARLTHEYAACAGYPSGLAMEAISLKRHAA